MAMSDGFSMIFLEQRWVWAGGLCSLCRADMARAIFLQKIRRSGKQEVNTYLAIVALSSALILTPLSCRYSYSEIFYGEKICITLFFLLKHMPSIGSK